MKKIFLAFIMVLFTASFAFAEFNICDHFPDYCKAETTYKFTVRSVEMCESLKCDTDMIFELLTTQKLASDKLIEEQRKVIDFLQRVEKLLEALDERQD